MKNVNIKAVIKTAKHGLGKHSPAILTGLGIGGMITASIFVGIATPKVLSLIDEEIENQNLEIARKANESGDEECNQISKLKPIEVIKIAWRPYAPAIITGAASIACLVGAHSENMKRNAALATAYELSRTALSEYKDAVIEELGEEKEKTIRERVDQHRLESNPVSQNSVIIAGTGDQLCYDGVSGRYFKSDIETIRAAINRINREMVYDNYISLSEFYDELGLEHTDVSDSLGWNLDGGLVEISFGTRMADDGRPCITLDYHVAPRYDFSKLL